MIPLRDDNPTEIRPIVTIALIAICVLVFLWQLGMPGREQQRILYALGVIPAVLTGSSALPPEISLVPPEVTVITSMFLHGGLLHLGGNMLYLWIFGNNIEDAMGHGRFVAFYLLSGTAAAMTQVLADPDVTVPMVGASGAIGGVLGAYLLLHPRAMVLVALPIFFFIHIVRVPAYLVLGLWFVLQFVNAAMMAGGGGGVAYGAHIGGFVAGAILILLFRKKGVRLFDQARPRGPHRGPWR